MVKLHKMSAQEEIANIEQDVAAVLKRQNTAIRVKNESEAAIPKSMDALAYAKEALERCVKNLKHMRGPADVVDLKEYQDSKKKETILKCSLEMCEIDLLKSRSRLVQANEAIIETQKAYDLFNKQLKKYGKLIVLPVIHIEDIKALRGD
jgi:hypothetical protein